MLDVTSFPDTTGPVISDVSPLPNVVDTTAGDAIVTLGVRIQDDVSGFDIADSAQNYYIANIRTQTPPFQQYIVPSPDVTQISGNDLDGVYRINWTIPRYSKTGTWMLQVFVRDRAGNQNAFNVSGDATFEVVSPIEDLAPPALTDLSFTPALVDTSAGPAWVTVQMTLTDNLSGVDLALASPNGGYFHGLYAQSPSTGQSRSVCCGSFHLMSGTNLDGVWEGQMYLPQYSEDRTWNAYVSFVTDHVRNSLYMDPTALDAAGLPSTLVVVKPSLDGDGIVDSTGGTGSDGTFGTRAELTFPAGTLPGEAAVAIDVKPDSDDNPINVTSWGVTPVAILSSDSFDAPALINRASLTFGATGTEASLRNCAVSGDDVNGDGLDDLLCFFYSNRTGLLTGATDAYIGGETLDGTPIAGSDSVKVLARRGLARGQSEGPAGVAGDDWLERRAMKCEALEQQRGDNAKLPPGLGCAPRQ